jgi:transcriptional regulator with XRE-family HTH domain
MTHATAQQIGHHVRSRREGLGLSVRKLAHLAGIHNGTLLRIEHGQIQQPRQQTLRAIDTALEHWTNDLNALPALAPYLRARYPQIPERVVSAMLDYFDYLTSRYGQPTSPKGADER